ncbi:MAG: hypothetical protein OEP48_04530 [Betaproteobacteria bacterium]|nr:hypothetical protein [Betaproteobacteria bacterium]MDH3436416.1 hypothetical protein [Betaproteobacteria bacterium]
MHEIESWADEKRSAYLYRIVAAREAGTPRQALFNELAQEAERQAAIWDRHARKAGRAVPESYSPDTRARRVAALVRWLGVRPLRGVLTAMKMRGMSLYTHASHGHVVPPTRSPSRLEPRPRFNVQSSRLNREHRTRNSEPGTWNLEPGTWNLELGTRNAGNAGQHCSHGSPSTRQPVLALR